MTDGTDPQLPPQAHGGWSTELITVDQAVLNHVQDGYVRHSSGVFDATGAYVHHAVHWRGRPLMVPPPYPDRVEDLPGRWLWAGRLVDHFGHFLTESTGRLWPLATLEREIDGIVYLPDAEFGTGDPRTLNGFQKTFFNLLGVTLPVRILTGPTRVERLEVPGQGFGIGPLITGTQPFRSFFQSRFALDVPPQGGPDLYVSRTRLSPALGSVISEPFIERKLAAAGYEIYHPQEHSLPDQIARYKAARRIIAVDGSALHLLAFVARPDQQIAVILRRRGIAPKGIEQHLTAFSGRAPTMIDVIQRNWFRSDRGRADHLSYGELNTRRLSRLLAETGFLPEATRWRHLTTQHVLDTVAQLNKHLTRPGLHYQSDRPLLPADAPAEAEG